MINPARGMNDPGTKRRRKARGENGNDEQSKKRRCISSACVPCRKRKSKCDGTTPACSACSSVYHTECIYDPNSDHRRKGVYKKDIEGLKTRNSTLQTLVQAILNSSEDDVAHLVQQIRTCENLDNVAETIVAKENGDDEDDEEISPLVSPAVQAQPTFESQLSGNTAELRLEDGSTRYIGGTSHLIYMGAGNVAVDSPMSPVGVDQYSQQVEDPLTSWTTVTDDPELVRHLINMYFCWHYSFFTTLSKHLFMKEFRMGKPPPGSRRKTEYCTPLLVNAMLALGCHFTSWPAAREVPEDSATAGDHFFREAKRLILEEDLHEVACLPTVQALALMSVREAGCGREAKGWVYSGMSFRMAHDLGLNIDMSSKGNINETEEDARRITFWGCFLFDKCWSNYLGRLPQIPRSIVTVPKADVFPLEDAETWSAYTDSGVSQAHSQPSRTRTVAIQISKLCEISSDLMNYFYNPMDMDKAKGKQAELKKLSEVHQRLETWRRELPKELEPKEGGLPAMLVMHMFFQLLYIHLFRPFLKYNPDNSPLPSHVSPRKLCTQAAAMISKLLRLYKRSHGLRQVCNIVVYIAHSACTIHLLNLPEKNAKRDIIHGVRHLEEIAEGWLCARRTLGILSVLAHRWGVQLPDEAATVLARTDAKFGPWTDVGTPKSARMRHSPSVEAEQIKIKPDMSPEPQPYDIALANTAAQFYDCSGNPLSTMPPRPSHSPAPHDMIPRSSPQPHHLPQNTPSPTSYPRPPPHPHTLPPSPPGSVPPTSRPPIDHPPPQHASSNQLFSPVDQLVREGQDWWLRDQNQLAFGFDNWSQGVGVSVGVAGLQDVIGWYAGQGQGQGQEQAQTQAQTQIQAPGQCQGQVQAVGPPVGGNLGLGGGGARGGGSPAHGVGVGVPVGVPVSVGMVAYGGEWYP